MKYLSQKITKVDVRLLEEEEALHLGVLPALIPREFNPCTEKENNDFQLERSVILDRGRPHLLST